MNLFKNTKTNNNSCKFVHIFLNNLYFPVNIIDYRSYKNRIH